MQSKMCMQTVDLAGWGGGVIFVFSWSVVYDDTLEYVRVIKSMKTR